MPNETRLAERFVLSCGTITLDLTHHKVLLIRDLPTNQILLPKGRKNIDETLADAAVRETHEETGYRVQLLPLLIPTLATTSSHIQRASDVNVEPFAVSHRLKHGDVLKIIFWFVATGDATSIRESDTQEDDEAYESFWVDFAEVKTRLTFEDDGLMVERAIELALQRG